MDREALKQRMRAAGFDWPDEELERLLPVLARVLPAVAALSSLELPEPATAPRPLP
jgi:hypothetical protein